MDVLADLLTRARATGALFAHTTLHGTWGVEFADDLPLSLHAALDGELWVEHADDPPVRLLQGDVALVRSRRPYRFVSAPEVPALPIARFLAERARSVGPRRSVLDGDGPAAEILCGAYTFDGAICDSLLAGLPAVAVVPAASAEPALRTALGLLVGELSRDVPGQGTVLDRLLDLLLVYALRGWYAADPARAPRWYAALADDAAGPALRAIHARPAAAWTVDGLAAEAGLSRAAFARRFRTATGSAPLGYVTGWRMALAAESLLRPGATLAAVADEVGYANEFGFAAAFKRHHGEAPGRWRASRLAERAAAGAPDAGTGQHAVHIPPPSRA